MIVTFFKIYVQPPHLFRINNILFPQIRCKQIEVFCRPFCSNIKGRNWFILFVFHKERNSSQTKFSKHLMQNWIGSRKSDVTKFIVLLSCLRKKLKTRLDLNEGRITKYWGNCLVTQYVKNVSTDRLKQKLSWHIVRSTHTTDQCGRGRERIRKQNI